MLGVYITKRKGYMVQASVFYMMHMAVYLELHVRFTQPIYEMLEEQGEFENSFNYIIGWPLYFLTLFFYLLSCLTPAGRIRRNWHLFLGEEEESVSKCEYCELFKPLRSHHCTRCRTCVCRRDHHCDFTNQCIGFSNIKPFLFFLNFAILGCLHFIARTGQWFFHWYYADLASVQGYGYYYAFFMYVHLSFHVSFVYILFRVSSVSWYNLYFNTTFIDTFNMIRTPWICQEFDDPLNLFHLGLVKNVTDVLGTNPLYWLLPIPPKRFGVTRGPMFSNMKKIQKSQFFGHEQLETLKCNSVFLRHRNHVARFRKHKQQNNENNILKRSFV